MIGRKIKTEHLLIIFPLIILIVITAVYFLFSYYKKTAKKAPSETELLFKPSTATSGTLPSFGETLSNPLEKMPEVNPVEQANPFAKVKINPFR